ncbi:hypothetical protein CK623_01360 [Vandammella animalimorsus]|uniref:IPTL-CTERM protein sorting domain-containing protein n=2 Tax=Vandammella animalimorsus TaxID=2029117 RepID=A0A2A2AUR8_9BURK|nr:hypothetical protein CK623_01360 [Vandammella animalimorsus]
MNPWGGDAQGNSNGPIDAGGPATAAYKDLNALAYNPRDNYLYAMKRLTVAPDGSANSDSSGNRIGLYRIGSFGGIPSVIPFSPNNGAPYQNALRVQFVDTAGNALTSPINGAAATFDRYGNYFMVDGPRSKLYVVQGLHSVVAGSATQPDPGPQKAWQLKFENEEAANLPAGYTAGFATIPSGAKIITDFAVRQAESTGTQSVLYGLGDKMDGKWYLYRFRVTNPQDPVSATSGHAAFVSYREITGMNIGGYMASAAMSRDGKLFVYASGGKVFEINVETGAATEVFAAVGAGNSDGASCMTSILAAPDGEMANPFKEGTNDASFQSDSVLGNDRSYLQEVKLDGTERNAVLNPAKWKRIAGPNNTALTLNTDPASPDVGKVTVAAGAEPGDYVYEYEICVWPEVKPDGSACSKAEVFIKVNAPSAPTLDAQPDNYGTVGVGPDPLADSVVENDTVAGASAVLDGPGKNAQLKPGSWTKISGPATDKPSLDYANGKVTVPVGTPHGDYVYEYELCADAGAPCKKAQVMFTVVALLADDENFGVVSPGTTTTESIYTGDTVDGVQINAGTTALLKPSSWTQVEAPAAGSGSNALTLNTEGKVVVPGNAAPGDYKYSYTICLPAPNNAICDTAEVKLRVEPAPSLPSIDAKDDDWQATPLVAGKSTTDSIFTNDRVGSANVAIGTNANLKDDWQPEAGNPAGGQGKLTLKNDGTIEAAKDAPAGIYKFDYAICLPGSTTCDPAKVTVKVEAAKIAARDDVFDNVAPGGTTPSIFGNDLVDGQNAALSSDWALQTGSWEAVDPTPGGKALVLNTNGTVSVPADAPAGEYKYRYRICRKAAPTECDTAFFTLNLKGAGGAPASATPVPVGAPWALGLAALGMLGVARRVRQRRQ